MSASAVADVGDVPAPKNKGGRPPVPDKVVPFTIGLPLSTWDEVDVQARRAGKRRIDWLKDAIASELARQQRVPERRSSYADPLHCSHPENRRVGTVCLRCGQKVGR